MCIAISTLFLEASKVRASSEQFSTVLTDLAISPANVTMLKEMYEQNRGPLLEHIEMTGISAPQLVGVDWRLDYGIRSKHGGRGNIPIFFVTLKLKDRGIIRDVDLIASQEELQDMLAKVRDAVKQTERVLNTTTSDS